MVSVMAKARCVCACDGTSATAAKNAERARVACCARPNATPSANQAAWPPPSLTARAYAPMARSGLPKAANALPSSTAV